MVSSNNLIFSYQINFSKKLQLKHRLLLVSYLVLGLATPERSYMNYVWIVQHPAGLVLTLNGFSLCSLVAGKAGLLISVGTGLMSVRFGIFVYLSRSAFQNYFVSSLVPQAWLAAVEANILTRQQIMFIWLALTGMRLMKKICSFIEA